MNKVISKSRMNNKSRMRKNVERAKRAEELASGSSTLENLASEILGDLGSGDSSIFDDLNGLLHEDSADAETVNTKSTDDVSGSASVDFTKDSDDGVADVISVKCRANSDASHENVRNTMRSLVARGIAKDNEIAKTSRSLGFIKVSDFDLKDVFYVGMDVIAYDSRSSGSRDRIRRGKVVGIYRHHVVVQYKFVTCRGTDCVTESFCMHDIATSKVLEAIA